MLARDIRGSPPYFMKALRTFPSTKAWTPTHTKFCILCQGFLDFGGLAGTPWLKHFQIGKVTVHYLSHPFETQSDLSLWFHTTPKGDVITGIRGKPEHSICDEALGFHFQGSQKYSESYFLKCDLWRRGVGRCLINGSLQTVAWSGKAVTTNSHSSGLLLSERFILTTYHVFFLKWQSEERYSVIGDTWLFLGKIRTFPSLKLTP